jgi:hypothetical protein
MRNVYLLQFLFIIYFIQKESKKLFLTTQRDNVGYDNSGAE